jgi:cytochrome c peroxidase
LAIVALGSAALAADLVTVGQRDRQFRPAVLQIARGTTIRIVNDDKVTHHIYVDAPQMKFDSGEQPVGTTVELTFDHDGNFSVRCAIHPTMRLQVSVE